MKRKVSRVKGASALGQKLVGVHVFRVSGPCALTGKRVVREFTGTRAQAERVRLLISDNHG